MRILVTWGSKRGEGIARAVAETLAERGFEVTACPAAEAPGPEGFEAAIIGGALYANRWHRAARRYTSRHAKALRNVPVWLFSSGPLDESAAKAEIAPTLQVAVLAQRIGARGHVTFGGRLTPDAKGLVAGAMAKHHAGDWRDLERARAWATEVADTLPVAPGAAHDPPARAVHRVLEHGIAGWVVCMVAFTGLAAVASMRTAVIVHALLVPVVFAGVAIHYFRPFGSRAPLPVALSFAAIFAVLDLVVFGGLRHVSVAGSIGAFWLPLLSIVLVTWAIGATRAMAGPARSTTTSPPSPPGATRPRPPSPAAPTSARA
jgi:menaquinone-dependent protoporphyrinogen oxidase